jgi:hypothetical protein
MPDKAPSKKDQQGHEDAVPEKRKTQPAPGPSEHAEEGRAPGDEKRPDKILVIDIGGSKVKFLATGQTEPRKKRSGDKLTPGRLVEIVSELADGWEYEAVTIGYPGLVGDSGPRSEPGNLGPGWVGFDYTAAFGLPVRIMNDAAMQALGSYEGGRMLFLGLGTGLGSALIVQNVLVTLELGQLRYDDEQTLGEVLGRRGLDKLGKKAWREVIAKIVPSLMSAFLADDIVLGGGNAREVKQLPAGARLGHNLTAFRGGFRLWHMEDVPTLQGEAKFLWPPAAAEWRLI